MEASRAFVAKHTARNGHVTDVDEVVRSPITWETVRPHRHEEVTEAIDREVHQHHYHITAQPLTTVETLPAKHVHNLLPVKEIRHQHDDVAEKERRLAAEASQFRNITRTMPTTQTIKRKPVAIGEHWHHHVHEIVQPIIYKETIQPETVHTTFPIREVHIETAKLHPMSALPTTTMHDYSNVVANPKVGHGTATYEGAPRPYDPSLNTSFSKLRLGSAAQARASPLAASAPVPSNTNMHTQHTPMAVNTNMHAPHMPHTPHNNRHRSSFSSISSSSSARSSPSSAPFSPVTPTMSPVHRHKSVITNHHPTTTTTTTIRTTPTKNGHAGQPVRVVGEDADISPRSSDESYAGNGRRSFMGRLTGRVPSNGGNKYY